MAKDDKKKKKSSPLGIAVAVAVVILGNLAEAADSGVVGIVIVLLVLGFFAAALVKSAKKKNGDSGSSGKNRTYSGRSFTSSEHVSVRSAELNYYDESNYQASTERDRQRRLNQLDGFLKNGIIGKDEYIKLRSRYEQY